MLGIRWSSLSYRPRRPAAEEVALEGQQTFEGQQRFLAVVYQQASERRMSRYVFLSRKGV